MAKVGYVRVSTEDQNLDRQEDALRALNVERVFSDKIGGGTTARPGLHAMLDYLREGDTLYVESISRLARSTRDLLSIVEALDRRELDLSLSRNRLIPAARKESLWWSYSGRLQSLRNPQSFSARRRVSNLPEPGAATWAGRKLSILPNGKASTKHGKARKSRQPPQ